MYVHLTAKALDRTLLFHDWTEALELWRRLRLAFPDARALCLMPNHPHVVAPADRAEARMRGVMSGYARWRGHRRGQDARCWQPLPPVEALPDEKHLRRTIRYVLLNPCRGELADDPLAWPLSTHRDLCGLGEPSLRVRDPEGHHRYVSADPSVTLVGTALPGVRGGVARLDAIEMAVGSVLRLPPGEVRASWTAKRLLVRAAWFREQADARLLADWLAASRAWVYAQVTPPPVLSRLSEDPWLSAVLRAIDDPRFGALEHLPRADPTRWSGWRMRPSRG